MSSFLGTIPSVFSFWVFTNRGSGYRWTRPSWGVCVWGGGGGGGGLLVPSLNFKTGCFVFWGGGHCPVCCGSFNQSPCGLLPFHLSVKALTLAGILPWQGLWTQKHNLTEPLLTKVEKKIIVPLLLLVSSFNSCKPLTLIQKLWKITCMWYPCFLSHTVNRKAQFRELSSNSAQWPSWCLLITFKLLEE